MEFCGSHRAAYEKLSRDVAFDLPQGWVWMRLGDLCTISTGKRDANYGETNGRYYFFTCATLPIRCNGYSFEGESILLAGNGDIGNISYFDGKFEAYQRTYVLQALVPSCLILRYLYWHLKANWVTYNNDITYGSAIPYIRLGNLMNYFVALPPLTEQRRIVARVEELLNMVDSLGAAAGGLETAAKRLDKKILDLAIRGKLVPQDPSDEPASELLKRIAITSHKSPCKNHEMPIEPPFEIPESWEWAKLGTISNYGHCRSVDAQSISADTWSLDLEEIEKETGRLIVRKTAADKKSASSKHLFCKGMVLYSKLRTYLNKVLVADMDGVCTSEIVPISVAAGIIPEFLQLVLMSPYFLQYTASKGYGVKMPRVGTNDMRESLIPIPPYAEQQRIVDCVQKLKHIVAFLSAP